MTWVDCLNYFLKTILFHTFRIFLFKKFFILVIQNILYKNIFKYSWKYLLGQNQQFSSSKPINNIFFQNNFYLVQNQLLDLFNKYFDSSQFIGYFRWNLSFICNFLYFIQPQIKFGYSLIHYFNPSKIRQL